MTHVAQQIRDRIKVVLDATTLVDSENIYTGRFYGTNVIPCIAIYDDEETIRDEGEELEALNAPVNYSRILTIGIEVRQGDPNHPDNAVDDVRVSVEKLMAGDTTLSGLAVKTVLVRVRKQHIQGDELIVAAVLQYRVWYRTTALDPETAI